MAPAGARPPAPAADRSAEMAVRRAVGRAVMQPGARVGSAPEALQEPLPADQLERSRAMLGRPVRSPMAQLEVSRAVLPGRHREGPPAIAPSQVTPAPLLQERVAGTMCRVLREQARAARFPKAEPLLPGEARLALAAARWRRAGSRRARPRPASPVHSTRATALTAVRGFRCVWTTAQGWAPARVAPPRRSRDPRHPAPTKADAHAVRSPRRPAQGD